jgi:pyruvate formate lyase activating enzyme
VIAMITETPNSEVPLIGSPYDLRVSMCEKVGETDIRSALNSGDWGFVHSFTAGSAVDGPGMRLVAWLTACQFKCVFCHNPDTWKLNNGMPVSLNRAIEVVNQYRHDLKVMKGGLTVSGGEPLLQRSFLMKLFAATQKLGVHTALDTNGYFGDRLSDDDLERIDLVMLGLKAFTPELHQRITGMDNKPVSEFARRLAARKRPVWIRFVLVPGWSDDPRELGRIADFAAELGNVERIDVLPFHQLGRFKWERLGMDYQLKDAQPPSREKVEEAIDRFRSVGLNVI